MKSKNKPKYSIVQNVCWMIQIAWKKRKRVPIMCVFIAFTEIVISLAQLYITPEILKRVEQHAPMGSLLGTIAGFTGILFLARGMKEYFATIETFPRIDVRSSIISMISRKSCTTSYPNTLDADFIKLRDKANSACCDNNTAAESIWKVLTDLLMDVSGFVIYLTILSRLNTVLLLVVIGSCLAGFYVSRAANNWVYERREDEAAYYAKKLYIRGKSESVVLAKDIRIFGLQDWLNDLLNHVHDIYLDFRFQMEKKYLMADITEAVLTMMRNGIAYGYLIRLMINQGLSVPEFFLYFTAVSTFTTWVMGILRDVTKLHKDSLDISIIREFLEYPEPFRFEKGEPLPRAQNYELRLENVCFRYPGADHDTIHKMNLTVHPGEKLAVVGLNGAGKTTLVKLLCGLFDPTEGQVLLNGRDIRGFHRREYYQLYSAVFQEFSVLDVTVAENIAQTAEHIDYERVYDCIEKAGMTAVIQELPQGLDTHVGKEVFLDGVLFSGGQMQRLMLARALYKDGPILMLDEPTAALDPIAENDIYKKYNDMTQGKTAIFISHRLASTRFCDRIIFMAEGTVLEEGTHENLLARKGEYAKLFEVQSRYYQEGREF